MSFSYGMIINIFEIYNSYEEEGNGICFRFYWGYDGEYSPAL